MVPSIWAVTHFRSPVQCSLCNSLRAALTEGCRKGSASSSIVRLVSYLHGLVRKSSPPSHCPVVEAMWRNCCPK